MKYLKSLWPYTQLLLGAFALCLFWRLFEFGIALSEDQVQWVETSVLLKGLNYDLVFVAVWGSALLPTVILINSIQESWGMLFARAIWTVLGFAGIVLLYVYQISHSLLGRELWSMSFGSMLETSTASLGVWGVLLILLWAASSYFVLWKWKNWNPHLIAKVICGLVLVVFAVIGWVEIEFSNPRQREYKRFELYNLAHNKTHFLLYDSFLRERRDIVSLEGARESIDAYHKTTGYFDYSSTEFPLVHKLKSDTTLKYYFNTPQQKPNVVFIFCEGLSRSFTGPGARFKGFSPFLDSLTTKSLYWENFLSNAEKTYGVLPNVLGSLPPAWEGGFNCIPDGLPKKLSAVSMFSKAGYNTSFLYGGWKGFDRMDAYLFSDGIDKMTDRLEFDYEKYGKHEGWGYSDQVLFDQAADQRNEMASPRLELYLTLSVHHPFNHFEEQDQLAGDIQMKKPGYGEEELKMFELKPILFYSSLYADRSIEKFFADYAKREDYENTIFILTGDHYVHCLPLDDQLERYHVPLIIYSPLLKKAQSFKAFHSHRDVFPSLYSLLSEWKVFPQLEKVPWLGRGLSTSNDLESKQPIALNINSSTMPQLIVGNKLLLGDQTFLLKDGLVMEKSSDDKSMHELLKAFQIVNDYVCGNNTISN